MAIGKRVPITLCTLSVTTDEGGSSQEVYTPVYDTWAIADMRKSQLNSDGGGTELADVYRFREVRFNDTFKPDKTMQVLYNGDQLTIVSILLDDTALPPYYTLTASQNG